MKTTITLSLSILLALFCSINVSAQSLLFDAVGSDSKFAKVGGSLNYNIDLNGNTVVDGKIVIKEGAVNISIDPAITPSIGGGITVILKVSDVDASLAGQFLSMRSAGGTGQGGIKLRTGTTDGTLHTSWLDAEWSGALSSKFPTNGSEATITYAYKRDEAGATGSAFYLNGAHIGTHAALKGTAAVGNIVIGGINASSSKFLNVGMKIHRVRIYAGQLTAAQVAVEEKKMNDPFVVEELKVETVNVYQGFVITGIGNQDHPLMYVNVGVSGFTGEATLKSVKFDLSEMANLSAVKRIKIYKMKADEKRLKVKQSELIGQALVTGAMVDVIFDGDLELASGVNKWGIAVDVADNANEGDLIQVNVVNLTLGDGSVKVVQESPTHPCKILLTHSLVIAPGDYGSVSYRIPAIAVAADGSLVAVTDMRKNGSGDLPADIDLIIQRSTDKGKTWSEPLVIAGENTTQGYGDAAIIKERETGKLIVLCVSGPGFKASTPAKPNQVIYFESNDNGLTWTEPLNITSQIYGVGCPDPIAAKWNGLFPASGRMTQLRSGRIVSPLLVRNPVTNTNDNFLMYSDDKGLTWHPSTSMAVKGGDEAKMTQRNDGKVIISSRQAGGRVWNVSNDETGLNWTQSEQYKRPELLDQSCNAEIMNYTSTLDGYDKDRMLHSLNFTTGTRKNVSILLSYDEGVNWTYNKVICAPSSAYSTFDILKDGTIGMYYEDGTHEGEAFEMVFIRFSLDWLTDGTDTYKEPTSSIGKTTTDSDIQINVQDNKIVVYGTDQEFQVFTVSGHKVDKHAKLLSGIYIVKVEEVSQKVVIQ